MSEHNVKNGEVAYPDGSPMGALSASKLINHLDRETKKQDRVIKALQKENEILRECVKFYADGEIGNDLEIKPEKKELCSIPYKWAQRSMSDHYAGKRARQALKEITN